VETSLGSGLIEVTQAEVRLEAAVETIIELQSNLFKTPLDENVNVRGKQIDLFAKRRTLPSEQIRVQCA
jgi:hypothetical protein